MRGACHIENKNGRNAVFHTPEMSFKCVSAKGCAHDGDANPGLVICYRSLGCVHEADGTEQSRQQEINAGHHRF